MIVDNSTAIIHVCKVLTNGNGLVVINDATLIVAYGTIKGDGAVGVVTQVVGCRPDVSSGCCISF